LNLLDNAVKYMEPGGRIGLTAWRENGHVVIEVTDTGVGIRADELPLVFEMFTQVDRSQRAKGGLGIGLTLVKRLVAMHGGTVEARSDGPGEGSEFVVRLPAGDESADDASAVEDDQAPSPSPAQLRILVVDDNRDSAESMAMFLRMTGHEISTAHDGLDAVKEADAFLPDVILLDIGLPGLNGYEVAQRIRAMPGNRVILIALTGWGQEEDRRRSKEAGFDHHLTKPINFDHLNRLLVDARPE
jgi:CheY-like chemotaxis protein